MAQSIILKEYEEKMISDSTCNLDELQKYLKCKGIDKVLTVTRKGVKASSYVGVLKHKKLQFQILPKLISEKDDNSIIYKNLLYMLSYTKKLDIKTKDNAILSKEKNPFIEILIKEYAQSLFECLKRLTPKRYVREEDNLNYLKGKIKFNENIKYNCVNQARFYCEFDEFSENNKLNQLFLFVATCLYNISNNSNNKKTLQFIINYYSDITLLHFNKYNVEKIKLTRNQELFKKPFTLAKMFIEHSSVDLSKNRFENVTLLWDMNKLFEEFIFEIMKRHEQELNYSIKAQRGRRLLRGNHTTRKNTYVDIMVEKQDEKIVLDTKYKKMKELKNVDNADIFQVSTYCLIHNAKHAILLYPEWEEELSYTYFLNVEDKEKEYKIEIQTIKLKYDNLKDHLEDIKKDIERILNI